MLNLQVKWDLGAGETVLAIFFFTDLEGGLSINCHDLRNLLKERLC